MEKHDLPANDAEFEAIKKDFNDNVVESGWSENGELIYVLKDEADLDKYAKSAEIILSSYFEPEIDFICKVMHADQKRAVSFECNFSSDGMFDEDGNFIE